MTPAKPRQRAGHLFTQAQLGDDLAIAVRRVIGQIPEKAVSPADHLEEASAGGVVLVMCLEVAGEMVYPGGQQRYLHLCRSGVTIVNAIVLNDLILGFLSDAHDLNLLGCRWAICPQNNVPNLSDFL